MREVVENIGNQIFIERTETKFKSSVPDPLEGVIEGENRHARYVNFRLNFLGKIWPNDNRSGEYGSEMWRTYRHNASDIDKNKQDEWEVKHDLVGTEKYYSDFSPYSVDPILLSEKEFENVVENVGTPDYPRITMVSRQLAEPNTKIIPTGGSCVHESWAVRSTKNLSELLEKDPDKLVPQYLANYARRVLEMAPTITHISGAILGGHDAGVHYDETDMWAEKITEFGVPKDESVRSVRAAYQRINEAVKRKSQLINPNAQMVNVDFDELNMKEGLRDWMNNVGEYNPQHRIFEVIYTYQGPDVLDRLRGALRRKLEVDGHNPEYNEAVSRLLQAENHARLKQVDHNRWEGEALPHPVMTGTMTIEEYICILPETTEKEKQEKQRLRDMFLDNPKPILTQGLSVMQEIHVRHSNGDANTLMVGFADLPSFGNAVQHKSRDVGMRFAGEPGTQEFLDSVEQTLNTPERLNRTNIDSHLEYLRSYTVDQTERKKGLVERKKQLNQSIKPHEQAINATRSERKKNGDKVERYEQTIAEHHAVADFASYLVSFGQGEPQTPEQKAQAEKLKFRLKKSLVEIEEKEARGEELHAKDQLELIELPEVIKILEVAEQGEKPVVSEVGEKRLTKLADDEKRSAENVIPLRNEAQIQYSSLDQKVQELESEESYQATKRQIRTIDAELKQSGRSYFPLSENPFVHHAMQFLWDSDFVSFLAQATRYQEALTVARNQTNDQGVETNTATQTKNGRKEKEIEVRSTYNEKMRVLMAKIYPKLEVYINYLYGRTECPTEMRNSRLFADNTVQ